MLKTEAISKFLALKTHSDLAAMYSHDMEVQVNVAKGDGIAIRQGDFKGREWNSFTNKEQTEIWKPIRIPYNAKSEPTYTDGPISYSIERHADGVGMTGWNWKERKSMWVAFDFDAIVGHSDRHGRKLTDEELRQIQDTVEHIPFVTLRKSTSGKGLHLYVMLEPVETANHTEHAALARAILSMLSGLAAFDFNSKVDTCGGNMWVWHRKMTKENEGLKLIKSGEKLTSIPPNWREHVPVVSLKARRAIPQFINQLDPNDPDRIFMELTGQRTATPLDCGHQRLLDWLATNGCVWSWYQESNMLITHTYHLKEAHAALGLRGRFETVSTGTERGVDHNCFAFPLRNGSWGIRRYSPGTKEADTWEQDGHNWTRCYYNREPDIHTLARMHEGVEHEKGGYSFRHAESVQKVLLSLAIPCDIPNFLMSRGAMIKLVAKENKLIVHIDSESSDDGTKMKGWYNEKKLWKRVFNTSIPHIESDTSANYEDVFRCLISVGSQNAGWVFKRDTQWVGQPIEHVKLALGAMGHDGREISQIVGSSVIKSWQLVNKPFQPEYPGNREWNRNAAQLAIAPTLDLDNLSYPTWTRVLKHCGEGLDTAILDHEWCKNVGITNGGEYLMLWIASLLKQPHKPSTYLAFWGNQNCGKSIFHEMISEILVTKGAIQANASLQSGQGFNYELENAILCYVEEVDLKADKTAYNRIKDWVTAPEMLIHPKFGTPYLTKNYTKWVQCSNDPESCPVFPGDTRITLCHVKDLAPENLIPKEELKARLRKEAPDFLAAVLNMELPDSHDRLAVPTIDTEGKKRAEEKNMTLIEQFIKDQIIEIPGRCVSAAEFFERFLLWMDERDRPKWTKQRVGREIPERFPHGRLSNDQRIHYGNMSFEPDLPALPPYKLVNRFLKHEE